jgi:hypothetical protein
VLRFAVFDDKEPFELAGAHLLGPEDTPASGTVTLDDGHVVCRRSGSQAVAVCLMYPTGRLGTLMLQTCLLPARDEPYILTVELARHRIKTFLAKSEEWQMFDLNPEHPAFRSFEKARKRFTTAITRDDPREADLAARASLVYGIEACERLAMAHAEILLHLRYGHKAASSRTLGVRVWPERESEPLRNLLDREFDLVAIPLPWRHLEVEEGKYRWEKIDRWMEWAKSTGKPVVAGPLLDFSKQALPDWIYVWEHDYETCRDLAYDHVQRVVDRYASTVAMWNLAAGLNLNDNFHFIPEQMIDLVRMTGLRVKEARRKARTMVDVVEPFGESIAGHKDAVPPIMFLDRLVQEGIRLDAVGVQIGFGSGDPGFATRDLMYVSSLLDRFFMLEIPVIISAAGVPSVGVDGGGTWHEGWSADVQARWAARVFAMAMSKPFVESIFWSELYDRPDAGVPTAGLITDDGKTKPALGKLVAMRKRLRKPLGKLKNELLLNPAPSS